MFQQQQVCNCEHHHTWDTASRFMEADCPDFVAKDQWTSNSPVLNPLDWFPCAGAMRTFITSFSKSLKQLLNSSAFGWRTTCHRNRSIDKDFKVTKGLSWCWRRTFPSFDSLRRLTVKAPDVRRGYWRVATHIGLFYALCMICQAFFCSFCFRRPGFAFPHLPSTSSSHIHRAVLTRQVTCRINLCRKTDGFVFP